MASVITTPMVFAMFALFHLWSVLFKFRQAIDAIKGGRLVALSQGGIVKHRIDEVVYLAAQSHDSLTDVHQLRRALANNVHAQNLPRFAMKDQFQPPGCIAANLPAGNFAIIRYADFIGNVFFRELFFCLANEGNLRDGIDPVRIEARIRLLVFIAIGARYGDAALLHRNGREAGETDHVTDGEDMRHLGAEILVDGNASARIGLDTGCRQIQLVDVSLPANGIEQRVARDTLLAFKVGYHTAARIFFHTLHFFGEAHRYAAVAQVVTKCFDDLLIGEFKQLGALLNQCDTHTERGEHAGVFHANNAAADDNQRLRKILQLEDLVAVDDGLSIDGDLGIAGRLGADTDDDLFGMEGIGAACAVDAERIGVNKTGNAGQHIHTIARQLRLGHIDLGFDDVLYAEGQIGHRDLLLHAVVHAVNRAVGVAREMQHGFAHRFAGNGAGVDTDAAYHAAHFNQPNAFPLLYRGYSSALSGGARADDEQIVCVHEESAVFRIFLRFSAATHYCNSATGNFVQMCFCDSVNPVPFWTHRTRKMILTPARYTLNSAALRDHRPHAFCHSRCAGGAGCFVGPRRRRLRADSRERLSFGRSDHAGCQNCQRSAVDRKRRTRPSEWLCGDGGGQRL